MSTLYAVQVQASTNPIRDNL